MNYVISGHCSFKKGVVMYWTGGRAWSVFKSDAALFAGRVDGNNTLTLLRELKAIDEDLSQLGVEPIGTHPRKTEDAQ